MPGIKKEKSWISWKDRQPMKRDMCWWRLKSAVLPELTLVFIAAAAICNDCVVPPFFHWDGWAPKVPPCEWKPATESDLCTYGAYYLSIENLEFHPCPFCGKTPRLNGQQRCSDGGVVISASQQNYNCWWLKCCSWGGSPPYKDPREIERIRREAFARVKETSCPKN